VSDLAKAKRRSFYLGKHQQKPCMTRESAIKEVVRMFKNNEDAIDLITLFGLSAEELLEGGALYEDVKPIEGMLND